MKPAVFFKLTLVLAFAFSAGNVFAQEEFGPEWGENASGEERRQNVLKFNFYKDAYDNQRYDEALNYYRELSDKAPKSRNNLYVYAINIYKNKIQRSRDISQRNAYVDTLMTVYDMRMTYFGDDNRYGVPYITKQKAKDYLVFRPGDRAGVRKVFQEAITANQAAPDLDFINIYFKELTDDFLNLEIETDFYIAEYEKLDAVMNAAGPEAGEARKTFDALVVSSKALDCEGLERIYKEKLAAHPNDKDQYAKAFSLMMQQGCNSSFFFEVAEKYFELDPSASTAIMIAKAFEKQGDQRKAITYLVAAADNEKDPIEKAKLLVETAGMELTAGNAQSAANHAKQASSYDPDNGYAYIFLAQAYVVGASSCQDAFDRQSVYWLAYDLVQRSRRIFADSPSDLKNADELLAQFRSAFPAKEELFFRGLTEGARYEVKCNWITGSTTVKEGAK